MAKLDLKAKKDNLLYETFDSNLADILIDALAGDPKALDRPEVQALGASNIKAALQWLASADVHGDYKNLLTQEGWRLMYKRKPPTPEEYLTPEWIGGLAEGLWDNVKEAFCNFMNLDPLCPKRGLALSTSIGWGKANPIDTNVAVDKKIDLKLEDGTKLSVLAQDKIEIEENEKQVTVVANKLLKKDLTNINFLQLAVSKHLKQAACRIKNVGYSYEYKKMGEIQVGDFVIGPGGEKFKVLEITDHGKQDVYKITLSDGRYYESMLSHLNTVHFRNSHIRPDKKTYDTVTTGYIMDHLDRYIFEIPTDDTFDWSELDYPQFLEMLPLHEYEPIAEEFIIPDKKRSENKIYIEKIEKSRRENCKCISLDYPWGLYIVEDGIITHNSLLSNLCISYLMLHFCFMREPYRILGHSSMTSYCFGLASWSLNKVWDLLGTPFELFIEQNPLFEKVARRDDVVHADSLDPTCSKILYSTAGRGSARMLFRNNLQMKMMSTEGHLLGNAQPLYSKIQKADDSYYEMKDVQVGDIIKSPTEGSTEVLGIFPQGKRDIYEIELEDGRVARASDNHLWKVAIDKTEDGKWNWQVVSTLQLIRWLTQGKEIEIFDESNMND